MHSLDTVRAEYQEAPLHECTDGLWRALLAHLTQLEQRLAALGASPPPAA